MFVRNLLLVSAMGLSLAACSSKDDQAEVGEVRVGANDTMTPGALDGSYQDMGGPIPGTQQDLVVNIGDRVFFGYDRIDLTPEAQNLLKMQADWMARYPNVNVVIEGHADERGTREYNLALGERRANSVKNYLTAMGVSPARIRTVSYGKEQPAVLGSTPEAWTQNRRGVTVVE